jgi:hypothetical protein
MNHTDVGQALVAAATAFCSQCESPIHLANCLIKMGVGLKISLTEKEISKIHTLAMDCWRAFA